MELHRTDEGFALYKEKTQIGFCALTPAAKGAAITAFGIEPQWRRKGYGSYLLKEALRAYAGYDREKATVFTAPLPTDAAELAFWPRGWHSRAFASMLPAATAATRPSCAASPRRKER